MENLSFNKNLQLKRIILLGFLLVWLFPGSVLLGKVVQLPWLQALDTSIYLHIQNWPYHQLVVTLSQPFNYNLFFHFSFLPENLPTFFYFLIVAAAGYLWCYQPKKVKGFLLAVLFGNILVHLVTWIDVHYAFRTRPFLVLPVQIDPYSYQAWKSISSYPSGHVRDTVLYATLIGFWLPKIQWLALGLIIFIMFSRLYQGAHYPTDIIAGALIGWAVAWAVRLLVELKSSHHYF